MKKCFIGCSSRVTDSDFFTHHVQHITAQAHKDSLKGSLATFPSVPDSGSFCV